MAITLRVRTAISHHHSPCFALIRAHRQGMAVKPLNHQKAVLRCQNLVMCAYLLTLV